MHVYVIYAHPSHRSFTYQAFQAFARGLEEAGHTLEIGDLYQMDFQADMDLRQYERESMLATEVSLPEDVAREQAKIDRADALAFIYPVWWSDCPAKLKGWFDRVLSYGYAYTYTTVGEHATSKIRIAKALALCPAGHTVEHLEAIGIAESMRRVMIQDRLLGVGVKTAKLEILGGMVGGQAAVRANNLERAYRLGREF
jgi:NAD(P)H dehydrogenase (quinone)